MGHPKLSHVHAYAWMRCERKYAAYITAVPATENEYWNEMMKCGMCLPILHETSVACPNVV